MLRDKVAEEIAPYLEHPDWEECMVRARRYADHILAIPEIAEALRLRNATIAATMPDLTNERVGEIMRSLVR